MKPEEEVQEQEIDISTALEINLNPIEIEMSTAQSVFIGKKHFPYFLLLTTFFQLTIYSILIIFVTNSYQEIDQNFCYFQKICINFKNQENFIFGMILYSICFILPSFIFPIGRGLSIFPLLTIIIFYHFYLPPWILYFLGDNSLGNYYRIFCVNLFINAFSAFLSSIFSKFFKSNFFPFFGITLAILFNFLFLCCYEFLGEQKDTGFLLYFFSISFCILNSCYLNYDLKQILKKRSFEYFKYDFFLGFVHLQTDWLFRFWYIMKRK